MHKHPILIALLLVALAAAGCVAGQPVSPADMAAVAPTVAEVVSQLVPQLAGTYTVQASDGAGNSHELSLKLSPDGRVELGTELAETTQLMESGTWLLSGEGDVVIEACAGRLERKRCCAGGGGVAVGEAAAQCLLRCDQLVRAERVRAGGGGQGRRRGQHALVD